MGKSRVQAWWQCLELLEDGTAVVAAFDGGGHLCCELGGCACIFPTAQLPHVQIRMGQAWKMAELMEKLSEKIDLKFGLAF